MKLNLNTPSVAESVRSELEGITVDYFGAHYIAASNPDGTVAQVIKVTVKERTDGAIGYDIAMEGLTLYRGESAHHDAKREAYDLDMKEGVLL